MLMRLPASLGAWDTPEFPATLQHELAECAAALPLQQALTTTSAVAEGNITVLFLSASADAGQIHAKVGIFYKGILDGCSCADDPTPIEAQTEYCELLIDIGRQTAVAAVKLL